MLALIILPIISIIPDYAEGNFPSDKMLDKDIHGNPNSSLCTYGKLYLGGLGGQNAIS